MIKESINNISIFGGSTPFILLIFIVFIYFLSRRDALRIFTLSMTVFSYPYSSFLKGLFKVTRPISYSPDGLIKWSNIFKSEMYSLPSTHVVFYTVFFGYLLYTTFTIKRFDSYLRHFVRISSFTLIVLVGISRVSLGVHNVKDVIFGYVCGLIYLFLLIKVERFLARILKEKQLK